MRSVPGFTPACHTAASSTGFRGYSYYGYPRATEESCVM